MSVFRNHKVLNLVIFTLLYGLPYLLSPSGILDIIGPLFRIMLFGFYGLWYYSLSQELNKIEGPKMPTGLIVIQCLLLILIPLFDFILQKFVSNENQNSILIPLSPLLFPINGFILIGILIYHLQTREKEHLKIKSSNTILDIIEVGVPPIGFFRIPQRIDRIKNLEENKIPSANKVY
jgi:hypothetical protein